MKNIWKSFVAMAVLSMVLCPMAWGQAYNGVTQTLDDNDLASWVSPAVVTITNSHISVEPDTRSSVSPMLLSMSGNSTLYALESFTIAGGFGFGLTRDPDANSAYTLGAAEDKVLKINISVTQDNGDPSTHTTTLLTSGLGAIDFAGGINAGGVDMNATSGSVIFSGVSTVLNNLTINGAAMTMPNSVQTTANINVNTAAVFGGTVVVGNDLVVDGDATFKGTVTVAGDLAANANAEFDGGVTITGNVNANTGTAKFNEHTKASGLNASGANAAFKKTSEFGTVDLSAGEALFSGNTAITSALNMTGGTMDLAEGVNVTGGAAADFDDGTLKFTLSESGSVNSMTFASITIDSDFLFDMTNLLGALDTDFELYDFGPLMTSSGNITAPELAAMEFFGREAGDTSDYSDFSTGDYGKIVFSWKEELAAGSYTQWMLISDGNSISLYGFQIPEPSTYAMFLMGLAGLAIYRRRAMKKK